MRGKLPAISAAFIIVAILIFLGSVSDPCFNRNIQDSEKTSQFFPFSGDEADQAENFIYELKNNKIKIIGYTGSSDNVTIPGMIESSPVTEIGDNAFSNNKKIKSLSVPDSVIRIGISAFENCQKLENVVLGNGVKLIDYSAFKSCSSLSVLQFKGDAPSVGNMWISGAADSLTIYYVEGKKKFDTSDWKVLNLEPLNVPDPPIHPSVISGESSMDFSWQMSDTVEPEIILGFEILYKKSGNEEWTTLFVKNGFEVKIGNLSNGTEYEVCVSAVNIAGSGNPSDIVTATPFTIPEAPVLKVVEEDDRTVLIWNIPNNMGSAITEYAVYRDNARIASIGPADTEYRIEGLEKGIVYNFSITASNCAGESSGSNIVEVMLKETYTASFVVDDVVVESATLKEGKEILQPTDPRKNGHMFAGWNPDVPEFMPAHDVIMKAIWHMITDVPNPVLDLYYNGEYQTGFPVDEGYGVSGDYSMKDAGNHMVNLTLKEGFVWSDGTYEIKELVWKINPKIVYVYPEKDQQKRYFDEDPDLKYRLSENLSVSGKLDRVSGENLDSYGINIGSLNSENSNYRLEMGEETVYFTIIAAYPGTPVGLEVIFDDECTRLRWCAPDFDGGCDMLHYEVWMKSNDGSWKLYETIENQEFCDISSESDTAYGLMVKAVNSAGASEFSEIVSIEVSDAVRYEGDRANTEIESREKDNMVFITSFILITVLGLVLILLNRSR